MTLKRIMELYAELEGGLRKLNLGVSDKRCQALNRLKESEMWVRDWAKAEGRPL